MRGRRRLVPLVVLLSVVACAGPNQLARESQNELRRGQPEKAYELAKRAVDKSPGNQVAHEALVAASAKLVETIKRDVRSLAARGDTLTAARRSLELGALLGELARYEASPPPDPGYAGDVRVIRHGAADFRFHEGQERLANKHPKDAYSSFVDAVDYEPGYPGLQEMVQKTYGLAVMRLAILPFENQTDVPELSRWMEDRVLAEMQPRVKTPPFRFTQLVGADQVYSKMTISQLSHLSREDAIALGRQIGARRVVRGRIFALNTSTNSEHYHTVLYRRIAEKDLKRRIRYRYEEHPFDAAWRQREISLRYEVQVIDTDTEEILDQRAEQVDAGAYTIYSSFLPEGDCKDYLLLPPEQRESDPDRAKSADADWQQVFGHLNTPDALERCRKYHDRTHYKPDYRGEFISGSRQYPVFLDDLPGADELALVALDPMWKPVFELIQRQDLK